MFYIICTAFCALSFIVLFVQGGPKSKLLPNYEKIVLNGIKSCQRD